MRSRSAGASGPVAVVDRRLGTEVAAERGPLLVAHDGDDAGAERAAELDRGDPAPAARTEHGQPVALDQAAPVDEPDPAGEVRDPEPGRLGVGEPLRNGERTVRRRQALLGERPVAADERRDAHDAVTHREADALARPR